MTSNAKANDKTKHLIAKKYAFHFLNNAYSLWFIYLPEYLKSCDDNVKTGLNYAYQVLIQMQKHNLNKPDEVYYFLKHFRLLFSEINRNIFF